jgi:peptidoglycan pentaglycine glycine transferase (the first glycine)
VSGAPLEIVLDRTGPDPEWDAFLDVVPGGHHVQTSRWADVKHVLGWRSRRAVVRRDGEIVAGCQLLLRRAAGVTVGYVPRGPVARPDDEDAMTAALDGAEDLAARERVQYLKVQPPVDRADLEVELRRRGFVASGLEAAPTATVLVDLRGEPDQLLARMRKTLRGDIRRAARAAELAVRTGGIEDLDVLVSLLDAASTRLGFAAYPLAYYRAVLERFAVDGRAALIITERRGQPVSAELLIGWGDRTVNKLGAWSGEHRRLHPNALGQWAAMLWARDHGYPLYDHEGVPPAAARAVLRGERAEAVDGATNFKLGFGGEVRLFPPAYDKSPSPMLAPVVRRLAPRLGDFRGLAHHILGRRPARARGTTRTR